MLPGISEAEHRELLMSVGTHKTTRPRTPVEVAELFATAMKHGATKAQCAQETQLRDPTMVGRFLRLTNLAADIRHLVDWGESASDCISFSSAIEISQFPREQQKEVALAVISNALTKKEVVSTRQLVERSALEVRDAAQRVLKRRPVARHIEVVMGAISDVRLRDLLGGMSQRERNDLLYQAVEELIHEKQEFSARLGAASYSLMGGPRLAAQLTKLQDPEHAISEAIRKRVLTGA